MTIRPLTLVAVALLAGLAGWWLRAASPKAPAQVAASASVEFEVRSTQSALIPTRALVPSVKGHSVFLLRDGKAVEQEVMIGVRTSDRVQILSGLKRGDVLLTSNLLRLRAGIPVRLE